MILFLRHHNGAAYFLTKEGEALAICSPRMVDEVINNLDPRWDIFDYATGYYLQPDTRSIPILQ